MSKKFVSSLIENTSGSYNINHKINDRASPFEHFFLV